MKRITFLYTHPIQYFAPLLKKISTENFCKMRALFCYDTTKGYQDKEFGQKIKWDVPLLEGYDYQFLPRTFPKLQSPFLKYFNLSIVSALSKKNTDIIAIHGWGYGTAILAILIAKIKGIEVWMRSETPLCQEILKKGLLQKIKTLYLQYLIFKCVDKFMYIGEQNKLFYQYYGVHENKLFFAPYSVDNDNIIHSSNQLNRLSVRENLGIKKDQFVILFSGKLIKKKNPLDLLMAFKEANLNNSILIFLGDGNLRNELEEYTKLNNICTKVIFAGFKNQSELSVYFKASDLFVLPSGMNETWGLVVNEAMLYGLPVIVSDIVGCVSDLVKDGQNGFKYPVGDIQKLSEFIKAAYSNNDWLENARNMSISTIRNYSFNTIVNSIKNELN